MAEEQVWGPPKPHAAFIRSAVARLSEDPRLVGVAAGGSYLTRTIDEFSDVDLVIAVEPAAYLSVLEDRLRVARSLGPLLAAFTGEHVGEPRVLICFYGPPLLHVDLKFVSLPDVAGRVEDPSVLWERGARLTAALTASAARIPEPHPQWIEDRFWVWVHYGAAKVGRGELFEACDFLGFIRAQVLGPLALKLRSARPSGVRRLELLAQELTEEMRPTLTAYNPRSCAAALRSAAQMYLRLRRALAVPALVLRTEAEHAAMAYLEAISSRTAP